MNRRSHAPQFVETVLPRNQILNGDCVMLMAALPANSIDCIFADPPYNLQLQQELKRPDLSVVDAVDDAWDQFDNNDAYTAFSRAWLTEARRVLKPTGTLWVIGSYHNIYRLGALLMDLSFWMLNDVVWHKTNPMPNFRGTRFQNATETMLWVQKEQGAKYTFNYHALKNLNDGTQMQNVWNIPLCTGTERLKEDGKKAHSTQKPEALLYRVIASSTNPGDVILDPFFGTGTTGAVAKKLGRDFIGLERDENYVRLAQARIDAIQPALLDEGLLYTPNRRTDVKVKFAELLESGLINVGQTLYSANQKFIADITADGRLRWNDNSGSIHQIGALVQNAAACNGWDFWFIEENGRLLSIDLLRQRYRNVSRETLQ